jgi:hypothetical protein
LLLAQPEEQRLQTFQSPVTVRNGIPDPNLALVVCFHMRWGTVNGMILFVLGHTQTWATPYFLNSAHPALKSSFYKSDHLWFSSREEESAT